MNLQLQDFFAMAPQLMLVAGGLAVLFSQLVLKKNAAAAGWSIAVLTLVLTGIVTYAGLSDVDGKLTFLPRAFEGLETVWAMNHTFRYTAFSANAVLLIVFLSLMAIFSMRSLTAQIDLDFSENYFLLLMSAAGYSYAVCAEDLITLFVGIELGALPTVILLGMNRRDKGSNEAALKYLLLSAFAIAFLLLGIALLYGVTGTVKLREIREIAPHFMKTRATVLAYIFILAGFFFKITAFPMHGYAADVYEGGVSLFVGVLASVSKIASVLLLFKIYIGVNDLYRPYLAPVLTVAAVGSMLFGSLASLRPQNLKRILAYSSVTNAGYMLAFLVIPAGTDASLMGTLKQEGGSALYIYSCAYGASVLLAFIVIQTLENRSSGPVTLENTATLVGADPLVKWSLALSVLATMGIPPLAGFFGKFYLFRYLGISGNYSLAAFAAAASGISVYAYVRIIRGIFFAENTASAPATQAMDSSLKLAVYTLLTMITFFAAVSGFLYNSGVFSVQKIY